MTEESKPEDASNQNGASIQDIEIEKILIDQSRWIVERYESINEGLMTRSASLAGFAGIELSLVGTMVVTLDRSKTNPIWSCAQTYLIYSLVLLTVVSLLTSIILLIIVLRGIQGATLPNHASIVELLDYLEKYKDKVKKNDADNCKLKKPIEQILMPDAPEDSYPTFLLKENVERAKNFKHGFKALIVSQVLLAILVLVIFWR